jgi:hypothetical protein
LKYFRYETLLIEMFNELFLNKLPPALAGEKDKKGDGFSQI